MPYKIIHEYECDGCKGVMHYLQTVDGYGSSDHVQMPGYKHIGSLLLCPVCFEYVVGSVEDKLDELRIKHGKQNGK
jgi:hypothetical protein